MGEPLAEAWRQALDEAERDLTDRMRKALTRATVPGPFYAENRDAIFGAMLDERDRRKPEDFVRNRIAFRVHVDEAALYFPWLKPDPNPFPKLRLWSLFSRKGAQQQ